MYSTRRRFLTSTATGVVSATAATLASTAPVNAQAGPARTSAFAMPRNMTLLNMRTAAGPRLGVKLSKGILDVSAAAARYELPAPVDTDDLLQNGKGEMLAKRSPLTRHSSRRLLGSPTRSLVTSGKTGTPTT